MRKGIHTAESIQAENELLMTRKPANENEAGWGNIFRMMCETGDAQHEYTKEVITKLIERGRA